MSRRLVRKLRSINNSQTEIKIKSATSNDSFGPTTQELNELALLTHNDKPLRDITVILAKRLNDNSRNWRHVLKSLTVIQYCLVTGSTGFVNWMKSNQYLISTLKEFQLKDHDEIAHQIRQKSRTITMLLKDPALLEEKRTKFHSFRSSMSRPSVDVRNSLDLNRAGNFHDTDGAISLEGMNGNDTIVHEITKRAHSLDMSRDGSSKSYRDNDVLKSLENIVEE
ncbi:epn2 [Cyberlindnera jadinii]|uniref:Epn2 protein n=2 Tax=Cyberlindnera jadinii (strain ATCC 18201 / CBS 1600 / BCRC 20928 / JCM 3617 / NBRC 0987 / NRRL Y-1542) TaxID=983966 RepID=A0A0H5C616_CYBJN|nr:epn2 [Cyberlindnera jadinii]